ncbi:MAG: hypothetical protein ACLRWQ_10565 [Flavonifractor plautii]
MAGAFPFASYELSDSGGIFLGLNLYNRSPVLIDFYDDYKYTNGNFAVFGSTGAGKSTILHSIGKRVREQGRKVICIVPEKGHEYRPLCESLGGQFIKPRPGVSGLHRADGDQALPGGPIQLPVLRGPAGIPSGGKGVLAECVVFPAEEKPQRRGSGLH